jgi:hypothetical protein
MFDSQAQMILSYSDLLSLSNLTICLVAFLICLFLQVFLWPPCNVLIHPIVLGFDYG